MKLPVYEFLGYRTRQIAYMIDGEEYPREMKISVPQSYFDEEKNLYQFLIVMDGNDMKDGKMSAILYFRHFSP